MGILRMEVVDKFTDYPNHMGQHNDIMCYELGDDLYLEVVGSDVAVHLVYGVVDQVILTAWYTNNARYAASPYQGQVWMHPGSRAITKNRLNTVFANSNFCVNLDKDRKDGLLLENWKNDQTPIYPGVPTLIGKA